jgi:hypothetical protein
LLFGSQAVGVSVGEVLSIVIGGEIEAQNEQIF